MKNWIVYSLVIIAQAALANEAEHGHVANHGPVEIPWTGIFVQAFNLGLLLLFLGFILRKTVIAHFAHRASEYTQLVERAANAKREAEKGRAEIQERLNTLESGAERGIENARVEAGQLRLRLEQEAKSLSEKLTEEAKRSAQAELERAKALLRAELLAAAVSASRENLKSELGTTEQKKLQTEFVDKIQVVS